MYLIAQFKVTDNYLSHIKFIQIIMEILYLKEINVVEMQ